MKLERLIASDIAELIRTERTCARLWSEALEKATREEKAGNTIKEFEHRRDASMWMCEALTCEIELAEEFGIVLSLDGLDAVKGRLRQFTMNKQNLQRSLEIIQEEAA